MTKNIVKLGDFIEPAPVVKCGDAEYPVLSMTMHEGIMLQSDRFKKSLASVDKNNYKVVEKGQLVIGFPIDEGVLYIQNVVKAGIMSPAYNVWNIKKDKINPIFLEYCLHSPQAMNFYKSNLRGSTARRRTIPSETLLNLPIPNVSFLEQENAISNITEVKTLINLANKQLDLLDQLVKSRFVEMFGDPKDNPNNFDIVPFEDCCDYIGDIGSNGANKVIVEHLKMKDEQDYALMVRFLNFTKNDFKNEVKYISKETYDFFKKSQIYGGELIFCKIGSAGQNYVMPYLNRPVSLGLNQIMVRINKKVFMDYLYSYLHTVYGEKLIASCINGAVTKTITKTELRKIPVVTPPLALQKQFADFVQQVDKAKAYIKQSLEQLETLKKKLMQDYFG